MKAKKKNIKKTKKSISCFIIIAISILILLVLCIIYRLLPKNNKTLSDNLYETGEEYNQKNNIDQNLNEEKYNLYCEIGEEIDLKYYLQDMGINDTSEIKSYELTNSGLFTVSKDYIITALQEGVDILTLNLDDTKI